MNQEELVNQLLPLLQEKLNVTTVKTTGSIFDALHIPENQPRLVPAHGASASGSLAVPEAAKEAISFPRLDNRLSAISIKTCSATTLMPKMVFCDLSRSTQNSSPSSLQKREER
jgi:hypothetical protein